MNGKRGFVPLEFLGLTAATSHEHQSKESGHDEDANDDEDEVHVQSGSFLCSRALDFIHRAISACIFTRSIKLGVKFHQTGFKARLVIGVGWVRKLCFNLFNVGDEVSHVPLEQGIVHLGRRRQCFGGQPLGGLTGLVFLTSIVNRSHGQTDVVHVAHAVDTCIASIAVG